ncbi:mitochondrial GTPase [Sporothrix brasiliensis 5110]|uniref:Mitochondrial GTPase n=1 Tax=Sporothrix brasiliensis 5110 TaxID=1398154 RepID=A0A0C2IQU8_9PEZI|nr:mitochondrial GTPase [Sporothrix brasiliensis 5110]KIH91401.1 mitochondrial GTPase [Sporothrix brasiliensis 5110]
MRRCNSATLPLRRAFSAAAGPRRTKDEASSAQTDEPPERASSSAFPDFKPRTVYEPSTGVPRSYFIGHHRAALDNMRRVLATVGLVIECRDMRVPLTAWNPLLESSLMGTGVFTETESAGSGGGNGGGTGVSSTSLPGLSGPVRSAGRAPLPSATTERTRIVVYTKRDLVVDGKQASDSLSPSQADLRRLAAFHGRDADAVLFMGSDNSNDTKDAASAKTSRREASKLVAAVRAAAKRHGEQSLTGLRALVVGMPNAGKSTLLNRLRARGMVDASRRSKAAATGAQPGVTRKLGTPVRVLDDAAESDPALRGNGGGVLVMDTPGVFVPYVADPEAMLKLALVGCVREGLVPPVALADYLLFQLNKRDPALYTTLFRMDAPTDDVLALLDTVARRIGKLGRGGVPSHEAAAQHFVTAWRRGKLGAFCLDDLDAASLAAAQESARQGPPLSMNQARKHEKERRKARSAARHNGDAASATTGTGTGGDGGVSAA